MLEQGLTLTLFLYTVWHKIVAGSYFYEDNGENRVDHNLSMLIYPLFLCIFSEKKKDTLLFAKKEII